MESISPRYLNSKQTMQFLNIHSYNTLYKFIDNGLPVSRIAGIKRFDKKQLEIFMEKSSNRRPEHE